MLRNWVQSMLKKVDTEIVFIAFIMLILAGLLLPIVIVMWASVFEYFSTGNFPH